MLLTPAEIKPKSFESRWNFFFFIRGGCVSCLRTSLGARLLPQSYQYPNLSEGADRVAGQLRGDKECPFSGVTTSGSLEEGAGKRCSECDPNLLKGFQGPRATPAASEHHVNFYRHLSVSLSPTTTSTVICRCRWAPHQLLPSSVGVAEPHINFYRHLSVSLSPTSTSTVICRFRWAHTTTSSVSYTGLSHPHKTPPDILVFDQVEGEFDGQCLEQAFWYAMVSLVTRF